MSSYPFKRYKINSVTWSLTEGQRMEKLCQKIKNKDRGCLPVKDSNSSSAYELKECFPCLDTPISYFFVDRFPFVQWLSKYSISKFASDLIAGLTVGLMVVPQALAYASIAQLPLQVCISTAEKKKFFLFPCTVWSVFCIHGMFCVHHIWNIQGYHPWSYGHYVATHRIKSY